MEEMAATGDKSLLGAQAGAGEQPAHGVSRIEVIETQCNIRARKMALYWSLALGYFAAVH